LHFITKILYIQREEINPKKYSINQPAERAIRGRDKKGIEGGIEGGCFHNKLAA